ncbi:MAG: DUF1841 family protein [Betaproteobacteria bacterium]|nr:DUF1841 family protein [Betaproteobacteria bacterium]
MFNPTRDQVRDFFFETWRRYCSGEPIEGAQTLALDAILLHPEYHAMLGAPERYAAQEYFPELGVTNPFLHLSLHVALEEQLSIDQPAGVRNHFAAIMARRGERHAALHDAIECLAEMVWQSQRQGMPPDGAAYLERLAQQSRK